jgi:predicted esterase
MTVHYQNSSWHDKKVIIGEAPLTDSNRINLLIGFHGADSMPENMLVHGNRLKPENTWMFFPEGPVDAGEGLWSWWQDGPRQKASVEEFLSVGDRIIQAAHRHLESRRPGSVARTCLWGFSQGAAASLVYTLLGGYAVAKMASVCGFLPELPERGEAANTKPAADILGIYGLNDDVVPSFLADHALEEMQTHGHRLSVRETSQGHEISSANLDEIRAFLSS